MASGWSTYALGLVLTIASAGVAPLATGCASPPPRSALNYTEEAKRAYDAAMVEFEARNWIECTALFRELKRKYGQGKYARLAELRIADADYEQEKFTEAIRAYNQFIQMNRANVEEVSYARSKVAEAQYRDIGDSFLLPSTDERDQLTIQKAYTELRNYLQDYPEAKESAHIRKLLGDVTARLIRHELYVARFYLQRDNYEAAVLRIQYALRTYSRTGGVGGRRVPSESDVGERVDSGLEPEALLLLGEVLLQMRKYGDARDAFVTLVRDFQASPLVVQARSYLAYMKERGV